MTTPEFGSIQATWSWTAVTPGVFSAMTLSPSRNRSSVIEPVEGDDAVRDLDPHARARRPLELVEFGLNGGLDLGVGMGRVRARRRGQEPLEEVGARDDADDGFSPQHRQALDAMADHSVDRLAEVRVLGDRLDVAGHHLARLAPVLMRIGLGESSAAEQEFEPMGSLALASELATAEKVALAQDPDQRVVERRRRTAR